MHKYEYKPTSYTEHLPGEGYVGRYLAQWKPICGKGFTVVTPKDPTETITCDHCLTLIKKITEVNSLEKKDSCI